MAKNNELYKLLNRENERLKAKIETLEDNYNMALKEIEYYKNLAESRGEDRDRLLKTLEQLSNNSVQKINNERGAGRKSKIDNNIIATVKMLKLQGKSIRAISKDINLSVGTVQKIINEHIKE